MNITVCDNNLVNIEFKSNRLSIGVLSTIEKIADKSIMIVYNGEEKNVEKILIIDKVGVGNSATYKICDFELLKSIYGEKIIMRMLLIIRSLINDKIDLFAGSDLNNNENILKGIILESVEESIKEILKEKSEMDSPFGNLSESFSEEFNFNLLALSSTQIFIDEVINYLMMVNLKTVSEGGKNSKSDLYNEIVSKNINKYFEIVESEKVNNEEKYVTVI